MDFYGINWYILKTFHQNKNKNKKTVITLIPHAGLVQNVTTQLETQNTKHTNTNLIQPPSTKVIIYLLTCPCGKRYIEKTSRELKQRIAERTVKIP